MKDSHQDIQDHNNNDMRYRYDTSKAERRNTRQSAARPSRRKTIALRKAKDHAENGNDVTTGKKTRRGLNQGRENVQRHDDKHKPEEIK